jgi:hypothetical protein
MGPSKLSFSTAYASSQPYLDSYARRIAGVQFSPDSKSLIFVYQGHVTYNPKYQGSAYGITINSNAPRGYTTYDPAVVRISVRFNFRTSTDGAINFGSSPDTFFKNMMAGLSGAGGVGDTSVPFTDPGGEQQFTASFRSPNGNFLYYISDLTTSRNHMVGFNITANTIGTRASWTPFSTHGSTIGFEQFDAHAWNYENRFAAVPAGVVYPPSGRDGFGIVFVIGSDSSAGALSPTDLEVYAFDSNVGGSLVALTSDVTDGKDNAINHIYCSADANYLIGQRCKTSGDSGSNRALLNSVTDLFVVTNVHAALAGTEAPRSFVLSAGRSHGATYAFVGENTPTGPQALIYSADDSNTTDTGNRTWDDRMLKMGVIAPNTPPSILDSTRSHYVVLAGARKTDDDPNSSN